MRAEGPGLDTEGVVKKCVLGVGRGVVVAWREERGKCLLEWGGESKTFWL